MVNIQKTKIEILQILRGYAALIVLFSHYFSKESKAVIQFNGQMGVAFFFLISGYLLVYSSKMGIENYWKKKAIRLLPLYYLTTIMVFVLGIIKPGFLHTSVSGWQSLVKSLCFIPYETSAGIYPLYPICWTLTIEVFVYLVYYLSYHLLERFSFKLKQSFWKGTGIFCAGILLLILVIAHFIFPETIFAKTYAQVYLLNFIFGMLICVAIEETARFNWKKFREAKVKTGYIFLGEIGFIAISWFFKPQLGWTIATGTFFFFCLLFGQALQFPKYWIQFGNATYSFYLLHYFVVKAWLRIVVPFFTSKINGKSSFVFLEILGVILCIAITTIISQVSYYYIEQKLVQRLKKLLIHD